MSKLDTSEILWDSQFSVLILLVFEIYSYKKSINIVMTITLGMR